VSVRARNFEFTVLEILIRAYACTHVCHTHTARNSKLTVGTCACQQKILSMNIPAELVSIANTCDMNGLINEADMLTEIARILMPMSPDFDNIQTPTVDTGAVQEEF